MPVSIAEKLYKYKNQMFDIFPMMEEGFEMEYDEFFFGNLGS